MVGDAGEVSSNPESPWSLKVIGGFCLKDPQGAVKQIPGRRERILLAYLAMTADLARSRQKLVGFLWGEHADNTTNDNLRTCLWSLRKAIDDQKRDLILSDRQYIRLNAGRIRTDLNHFWDLVDSASLTDLEKAAALAEGEVLEGIDLDSEDFSDWIRTERANFGNARVQVLLRLAGEYEHSGQPDVALKAASEALDLDPFNEVAVRSIMRLQARVGRRHMAIQAYRAFAEHLKQELDIEPDFETQELLANLSPLVPSPTEEGRNLGMPLGFHTKASAEAPSSQIKMGATEDHEELLPPQKVMSSKAFEGLAPAVSQDKRRLWIKILIYVLFGSTSIAALTFIAIGVIFWRVPALAPPFVSGWISGIKAELEGSPPSIAVIPFRAYGSAPAIGYAGAISDGIGTALSATSNMLVISQSSVEKYRSDLPAAPEIAKRLSVRYLLEGSVTKLSDTIVVRVRLVDTYKGERTVFADTFQKNESEFAALQSEVTLKVVTALNVRLTEGEKERINQEHGTNNLRAWFAASQGFRQLLAFSVEGNTLARRYFEEAVEADPRYPSAWSGLAWTYLMEARWYPGSRESASLLTAKEHAEKALSLDAGRGATHALLGAIALMSGDYEIALREGERAVELEYNDPDSSALYALTLTYTGQPRKAINLLERAIRLRPYVPRWYYWLLARANRLAGRPKIAIDLLLPETQKDSPPIMALVELAVAYNAVGNKYLGRAVAAKITKRYPTFSAEEWLKRPTYLNPEQTKRDLQALRAIGLSTVSATTSNPDP